MRFFVKQSKPSKKGTYLQIYQSFYKKGFGGRNKSYKVIGYVDELISQGISDPFKYAQDLVDELNENIKSKKNIEIGDISVTSNIGYFLIKSMIDNLDVDRVTNIVCQNYKSEFRMSDFIRTMIYAQIISPGSKLKAFENVIPNIYGSDNYSYDQILNALNFIGNDYSKFIELYTHQINEIYGIDTSSTYFDCTNYYFEIDLERDDLRKGPSKENRKCPLISQALMLDSNQIPIAMEMFPGNESEKPHIRKQIEDIKVRYDINGRVIQVADKGLNCAKNIYSCVKEASDGYIFSKSFRGRGVDNVEKKWMLLEDEKNIWKEVKDSNGNMKFRYKELIDTFDYKCILDGDEEETKFRIKEKRIVTYSPTLARKQRLEIQKEIDKAQITMSIKQANKDDYGDSIKYVKFESLDEKGNKIKIKPTLNEEKIEEDLLYAGYNLLVTSELNKSGLEIYSIYHNLWKIEESFRVMKTYLEARPVYLQKKESIYGHFLICYLALVILRLLELKIFNNEISVSKLISFIRDFNITSDGKGSYINNATKSEIRNKIKKKLGLSKMDVLYLSQRDINLLLKTDLTL